MINIDKLDLQAYLNRIGFIGEVTLTTKTLFELATLHMYHVPFENLDIHYSKSIDLKIDELFQKIVLQNRGGFCYELNGLFCAFLVQLGFDAYMVSARVYIQDKQYSPEFDHMAIWVSIGDLKYLVDVGFGDFIIEPLQIIPEIIQSNTSGKFVINALTEKLFRVYKLQNEKMIPQYQFSAQSHPMKDFVPRSIFHQMSPFSHFTKKKLISKAVDGGRITLNKTILKITKNDVKEETEFEAFQFEEMLLLHFGLSLKQ